VRGYGGKGCVGTEGRYGVRGYGGEVRGALNSTFAGVPVGHGARRVEDRLAEGEPGTTLVL
jgi:hypothetical protein